jgi:hypothetical protein
LNRAVPKVWGGEEAAKGMWKYRMSSPALAFLFTIVAMVVV